MGNASKRKDKPEHDRKPGTEAADNPQIGRTISGDTGGGAKGSGAGRQVQHGQPDTEGGRGSSEQGPKQDARGGPAGANQGGASRGASRLEPSHAHEQQKQDRAGKPEGGKEA